MLVTTLNKIKSHNPCKCGWGALLKHLGKTKSDDEPLAFLTILESNGFDDALWCMRSAPEYEKEWRLFAVWCARKVQHLITDERSIAALDVAEKYANVDATEDELNSARASASAAASNAAWDATKAAASNAASDAEWASASAAVSSEASAAAWATTRAAASSAASAAVRYAARAATSNAARAAARSAQKEQFIKIISG